MRQAFRPTLLLFAAFLAFYSWQKYAAAAPASFNQGYAMNVAILVTLTAILPFILTLVVGGRGSGIGRWASLLLLPLVFSAAGFATFFYLFIAPNFEGAEIMTVLPRSLFPGLSIAAILIVGSILRR